MSQESTPYDAAIADLEGRIRYFETMLESMKQLRSQITGAPLPTNTNGSRTVGDTEIQHDTFFGMTIGDGANKYLKMVKVTKPTGDIAAALEQGGLKHSSKDFNTTVRSVLGGREDFLRVNGDWGLTEWYPGMRNKDRKPKAGGAKTAQPAETESSITESSEPSRKERKERPEKEWVPSGNAKLVVVFLASRPEKSFTSPVVTQEIGAGNAGTIASLLYDLAQRGRVDRVSDGYRANAETIQANQRLGVNA